jgi:hypothetical protein
MIQRILAVAAGFLVIVTLSGWGHEQHPSSTGQPQAARAIQAMTSDTPQAASLLPADFASVMGYRPVLERWSGRLEPTRSDGSCSSPFGGTWFHFTDDCKRHDLGYDLLRYANHKGQPLGPWARKAIDAHFSRQTHAQCHQFGCGAVADVYTAMVDFNSWRQGYGTPVFEPLTRLVAPVAAGLGVALLLATVPLPRRRTFSRLSRLTGLSRLSQTFAGRTA